MFKWICMNNIDGIVIQISQKIDFSYMYPIDNKSIIPPPHHHTTTPPPQRPRYHMCVINFTVTVYSGMLFSLQNKNHRHVVLVDAPWLKIISVMYGIGSLPKFPSSYHLFPSISWELFSCISAYVRFTDSILYSMHLNGDTFAGWNLDILSSRKLTSSDIVAIFC